MALVIDENSYAEVDDADEYFEDHIYAADWDAATFTVQEQALVTATRMLDRMPWAGVKTSDAQDLQFPRTGLVYQDGSAVDSASVPTEILHAVYELAKHLIANPKDTTTLGELHNIRRVKAGSVEVEFIGEGFTLRLPSYIQDIIKLFLSGSSTYSDSDYGELAVADKNYLGAIDNYATVKSTSD